MSNRQLSEKHREAIRWVSALRSGRYKQVRNVTKTDDGHCAVAVYYAEVGNNIEYYLESLTELFGYPILSNVIRMNDSHNNTFPEIADFLERELLGELLKVEA